MMESPIPPALRLWCKFGKTFPIVNSHSIDALRRYRWITVTAHFISKRPLAVFEFPKTPYTSKCSREIVRAASDTDCLLR